MASENTIIIDVDVQASEAAEKLAKTKNEIAELKKQQKDLNATIKENGTVTAAQAQQMANLQGQLKSLTQEEKMYTAQLNTATDGNKEYGKSILALSAELNKMRAEYNNMSKEMREGEKGQQLQASIQQLDKALKESDDTIGVHIRHVGDYRGALNDAGLNVQNLASLFQGGFKKGLSAAGAAIKGFTKTLMLNPILAAVSVAFMVMKKVLEQLRAAFQRNDEAGTALQVALSRLQPFATALMKVFDALALGVAKLTGWILQGATAILRLIPSFKKAQDDAKDLVIAEDELQEKQREFTTTMAERNKEIAELNKEARTNENLTAKEREEMYKRMDELALKNAEDQRNLAQEEYEQLVEKNKQKRRMNDDDLKKEREYYNKMIEAQTNYLNETTRMGQKQKQTRIEQENDAKQKAEEARRRWEQVKQARQEAAKTELSELRKLEDMTIAMISDEAEREIAAANAKYTREVADLQKRLDEEKNLTAKAREAINAQIVLLEKQHTAEVEAIREKYSKEALDREIAAQREIIDARIAAMDEGQAKEEAAVNAKYAAELQDLRRRLAEEADLTVSEREALNERIKAIEAQQAREIEAIRSEAIKRTYDALALDLSNRLERAMLDAGENARMQAEAQLRFAEQSHAALLAMDEQTKAAMYDNEAQYQAAVLASEKAVYDARKANEETLQQQASEIGQTMQAVTSSLSDLFGAAAEDTEAYEKFKKAMAIVDAMISMATTIAAATTASTQGDPYTMAIRIAANVAAVTAQFAAVIKAIKAAAIPSAPAFSEGGVVPGDSWTGDKVTARLNSGEMVLTKAMQENLLRLLANGIPAATIDYNRLEEAFRDAVSEIPNPVMIYSEFEQFQRNVKKIRNITKI